MITVGARTAPCPVCGGRGVRATAPITVLWGTTAPYQGQAQIDARPCLACGGSGRIAQAEHTRQEPSA